MKKLFASTYLPVFLFCLLTGTSCKKDDDSVRPEQNENSCVLTKITYSGVDSIVYQYDSQKYLKKAEYSGGIISAEQYYKEYTYDTKGRIIKETFLSKNGQVFSYFEFEYTSDGLLNKMAFYIKNNQETTFTHQYDRLIEYTSAKQVSKTSTYHPGNAETPFRYDVYSYDASGNVLQIKEYANADSGTVNDVTTEYTYDTKKNPYLHATYLGIGAETVSTNNVVTEKVTYHLSGLIKNYTSTYLYNEQEYPVKQTLVFGNQTSEIIREYSCVD